MIQAKLNTELYQKMFAEQEKFKDWLRTLTPDEVLTHAYEYTCREDILLSMEYNDLSPDRQWHCLNPRHHLQMFSKSGKSRKPITWKIYGIP